MSLFFDAEWFDARLLECGRDRAALGACAGLAPSELHQIYTNARVATPAELTAFAALLGGDLVEITLRAGVSERPASGDASARIESIEARLSAIDEWLAELEARAKQKSA